MSNLSFAVYVGDGGTGPYAAPFPYLDKSHISVKVDGVAVPFTWVTDAAVALDEPAPAGAAVEVRRTTPRAGPIVDFTDGSILTETDLDTSMLQQIYIAQEVVDLVENSVTLGDDGHFTAANRRIADLATPTSASDAATKAYADSVSGADQAAAAAASASAAAGSASAASGSASAASSSASAAAGSENAASNSAQAAAASAAVAADAIGFETFGAAVPLAADFSDSSLWSLESGSGVSARARDYDANTRLFISAFVLEFVGNASDGDQQGIQTAAGRVNVWPGAQLEVSLPVYSTGSPSDNIRMFVGWWDSSGNYLSGHSPFAAEDADITPGYPLILRGTVTAPVNAASMSTAIIRGGTDTTGKWFAGPPRVESVSRRRRESTQGQALAVPTSLDDPVTWFIEQNVGIITRGWDDNTSSLLVPGQSDQILEFGGDASDGGQAVRLSSTLGRENLIPVSPGQRIRMSALVRSSGAPTDDLRQNILCYDKDGAYLTFVTGTVLSDTGGAVVTMVSEFQIPSDTHMITPEIARIGTDTTGTWFSEIPHLEVVLRPTAAEMQAGALTTSRDLSPADVRAASGVPSSSTLPINCWIIAENRSGGSVSNGSSVAGSSLVQQYQYNDWGAALSGTWRNISGITVADDKAGLFVRIA